MKTTNSQELHPRHHFTEWYHGTPIGQALKEREAEYLKPYLKLTYNQRVLQVGWLGCETDFWSPDCGTNYFVADLGDAASGSTRQRMFARADALPIDTGSIDVVVLPHVIEFYKERHQILREVDRVLKCEGRLIVLGFNPWSLHGLVQCWPKRSSFWKPNFVGSDRLLDWLALLNFEAELDAAFTAHGESTIRKPTGLYQKARVRVSFAYAVRALKRRYMPLSMPMRWVAAPSFAGTELFHARNDLLRSSETDQTQGTR